MDVHFSIIGTSSKSLPASEWECLDCAKLFEVSDEGRFASKPVAYCFQTITCPDCGSVHFVFSAGSKRDCVELEPVLQEMAKDCQIIQDAHIKNGAH